MTPRFDMPAFIATKKYGGAHSADELDAFVAALVDPDGSIPDYQVAAWLMAVCWRDLDFDETAALTLAMAAHGRSCDWADLGIVVDKHSTGGVGDKTSLVLIPLVASLGLPVAKFSGRALGFTGGTLDKLESIGCFTVNLNPNQMRSILTNCGCVIAGQSADMVPADKLLYALRDVTVTVDNIALIAASIMSKKIAGGANGIVLDVKFGDGAFMRAHDDAQRLADTMVAIGERTGRVVHAMLSSMEQPLGHAVGNALEVKESIATLRGAGPADLVQLCAELAYEMVQVYLAAGNTKKTRPVDGPGCALEELTVDSIIAHLHEGHALHVFRKWVSLQGGDPAVVEEPDRLLPEAPVIAPLPAPRSGTIGRFHTRAIGELVRAMGGGRLAKGDIIDPAVGLVLHAKLGDSIAEGEPLAMIHARSAESARQTASMLLPLIEIV
ncbi:MAG: thymidine phosphorylase [bacterium]